MRRAKTAETVDYLPRLIEPGSDGFWGKYAREAAWLSDGGLAASDCMRYSVLSRANTREVQRVLGDRHGASK